MEWIKLEIFYHPKHSYNLATMMDGMKKSIEYYSELMAHILTNSVE